MICDQTGSIRRFYHRRDDGYVYDMTRRPLEGRLLFLLVLLAAAGLRLWVLQQSHSIPDGDEAVVGMMALRLVTRGEFAPFFYGQPYMAPADAWIAAPFMALFGGSGWLKAGPLLWSVALVGLNGLLASLLFKNARAGAVAALLTAFPPLYFLVNNLRTLASFGLTLVLGDLLLLLAYRLVFHPVRPAPRRAFLLWGALGLVAGFGFYALWLVALYYVPVFFYLFLKDRAFFLRREFGLFIMGFGLGSLPFWLYNFSHNFETFRYFFAPKPGGARIPASAVADFFFTESLPLVIGARQYWFPTSWRIALALTVIWLAIIAGFLVIRRRGWLGWFRLSLADAQPVDMLLLFVLFVPVIFIFSGIGRNAFALPGADTTGRYLLPLMALAPVLAGGALARLTARPAGRVMAILGLAALLLGGMWPYRYVDWVAVFQSPYYASLRPPLDNRPVVDYLRSQGIEYATCNHWVGNRLMLEAEETVKCVDYYDVIVQHGPDRFPEYTRAIQEPGRRIGFVLVNPSGSPTPLEARLRELAVDFTRRDFPPYTIIIPTSRNVAPGEVANALGYPY